jgi:hypothetical protein
MTNYHFIQLSLKTHRFFLLGRINCENSLYLFEILFNEAPEMVCQRKEVIHKCNRSL